MIAARRAAVRAFGCIWRALWVLVVGGFLGVLGGLGALALLHAACGGTAS